MFKCLEIRELLVNSSEARGLHFVVEHQIHKAIGARKRDGRIPEQGRCHVHSEQIAPENLRYFRPVLNEYGRCQLEEKGDVEYEIAGFFSMRPDFDEEIRTGHRECQHREYFEHRRDGGVPKGFGPHDEVYEMDCYRNDEKRRLRTLSPAAVREECLAVRPHQREVKNRQDSVENADDDSLLAPLPLSKVEKCCRRNKVMCVWVVTQFAILPFAVTSIHPIYFREIELGLLSDRAVYCR